MKRKIWVAGFVVVSIALVALVAACAPAANTTNTSAPAVTTPSAPATTSEETSENSSIQTTTEEQSPVELGRTAFETGKVAGTAIAFTGGLPSTKAKGVAACADCHGTNGKGKKGLGPDITPAGLKTSINTEALFSRAVTQGLDETGKPLKSTMPKFQMTPADVSAVYAYLQTLQ